MALSLFQRFGLGGASGLFESKKSFLGADIGSSSIKLVQLRKEKERAILETYGELSLAKYGGVEVAKPVHLMEAKLTEALQDLLKEAKITAKDVVASIPLKDSFLTTMELPELSESELKEAVPFEARKYIPIPISEVELDWWVLPPETDELSATSIGSGKKKFANIILAAVPKDIMLKYRTIFKKVGLNAALLEIEVFSFARAALKRDFGTVMLMDLGASSIKMAMADGGIIRSAHSFEHGSAELSLALSQSLAIEFERAEVLKRQSGVVRKPETEGIASVLEPLIEFWMSEGERFLLSWRRRGGRAVSRVQIGGGGALLRGIEDTIVKRYGVEVGVANPFSKVVYPAFLEPALKEVGSVFVNAVGLALREF